MRSVLLCLLQSESLNRLYLVHAALYLVLLRIKGITCPLESMQVDARPAGAIEGPQSRAPRVSHLQLARW